MNNTIFISKHLVYSFMVILQLVDFNNIQLSSVTERANSSYIKKTRFINMSTLHNTSAISIWIIYLLTIDYKEIEKVIVKRLLYGVGPKSSSYIILREDEPYGFGNNFRSLLASVLIALLSGKRLRSNENDSDWYLVMWDNYFLIMENDFDRLRFNNSEGKWFFDELSFF